MATFRYQDAEYELIDPDAWTTLDAIELQGCTGRTFAEILDDLRTMGAMGIHCAVLISLRRAGLDVTWNELQVPYLATFLSVRGEKVVAPPDPSTASTAAPKAVRRTRSAPARSRKK